MKTLFAATLLLLVAGFSAPIAWVQLPTAGSNTSRRPVPQPTPAQPAASAKPAQPSLFRCVFIIRNGTGGGAYTNYVNDDLIHADAMSWREVTDAWIAYIGATYSIPLSLGNTGQTSCSIVGTEPPTYTLPKFSQQEQQWTASGHTIIHVNWTYTPGSTPAAAVAGNSSPVSMAAAPSSVSSDPCTSSTPGHPTLTPGCGATATVRYVVCSAMDASPTAYVSATFQVTAMDIPGWTNAFAQFLAQKYSYKGTGVGCTNLHEDAAQTYLRGRVIGLRANGKTVVETGWTFGSAPAVAVAAALPITTSAVTPPAPAAPPPPRTATPAAAVTAPDKPVQAARYAVCFGIMGPPTPSLFFSGPFQVTAPRTKVWSDAFREMLQQKYQFVGTISCGIRGATLEAAKTFAQTEKNSSRGGRKVVDTGWKFEE